MDERVSFDSSIKQTALRGGETAVLSKINKQANQSLELHYKIQSRGEKIKTKQKKTQKKHPQIFGGVIMLFFKNLHECWFFYSVVLVP